MGTNDGDMNTALMVDGNAAGGMLYDIFNAEMTAAPTECANCGQHEMMGQLQVFAQAPGHIFRCPSCNNILMRVVKTDQFTYLDARGAVYLRIAR